MVSATEHGLESTGEGKVRQNFSMGFLETSFLIVLLCLSQSFYQSMRCSSLKAEIRKQIKKEEGDKVHVILYPDNEPLEVPEEMLLCLQDEPAALKFFNSLSESEQKFYMQWVYSAKKEETKIDRLAKTIDRLLKGLKMYDKAF